MRLNEKLMKRLKALLKKFKLEEYQILFENNILSISSAQIRRAINTYKFSLSSGSIAEVCTELINKKKLSVEELESLFYQLYTYDVAFHPAQCLKWTAASLELEVKELPEGLVDLNSDIVNAYNANGIEMAVFAFSVYYNKIVWTVIVPKYKLKKGGLRSKAPILFAYKPDLERPHFLLCPSKLNEQNLHCEVYSSCLGYDGYSLLEYEGSDAISMFDVIQNNYQAPELPIYCPAVVDAEQCRSMSLTSGIMNYSHAEERKEYANKLFTKNTRQYFKVECDGTLLDERPRINASRSRNEEIEFVSSMEFQTSGNTSVEEMMRHLISIGAVKTPIPEYILQMSSTPSNTITIHNRTHLL